MRFLSSNPAQAGEANSMISKRIVMTLLLFTVWHDPQYWDNENEKANDRV